MAGIARIVLEMVYGVPSEPVLPKKENFWMNAAIGFAAAALIVIGLWMPPFLEKILQDAAALAGQG